MKLILASASPRRRALLKKAGLPFRVMPSHASEKCSHKNPILFVRELARRKAQRISQRLRKGLVLGADTVVVHNGKILGKPADARDAYRMLYKLSGSRHRVYTGVSIINAQSNRCFVSHAVSVVKMRKIPLPMLLRLARKHLDKAGSYAIQEKHDPVARIVKGSYDNVVGLPVKTVKSLLKKHGRAA